MFALGGEARLIWVSLQTATSAMGVGIEDALGAWTMLRRMAQARRAFWPMSVSVVAGRPSVRVS